MTDTWCILRTSGSRTLKLAAALNAVQIEAWTPTVMVSRLPRGARLGTPKVEQAAPLIPTFVFARACHLPDLLGMLADPMPPAVPFNVLRYGGRIPLVAEAGLSALRAAEEREHRRRAKKRHHSIAAGTRISPSEGAWAGLTGVVESSTGKAAQVNFGGGFVVSIATYLLESTMLHAAA